MESMIGYDRAIIIDGIQTDKEPGTIHVLSADDIPTQRSASAHDVNLPTSLEFGRRAGAHLPSTSAITLIGIEVADVQTFDETLTPELERTLPHAVEVVLSIMEGEGVRA
jgi:hydrogenase maturation protease